MQCNSCGTILPSGANNCPNCGAPVFQSNPFHETVSSSASQSQSQPQYDIRSDRTFLAGAYNPGSSYPPANPLPLNYDQPVYPSMQQQQPYYPGGPQAPYAVPQTAFPPPRPGQPAQRSRGLS